MPVGQPTSIEVGRGGRADSIAIEQKWHIDRLTLLGSLGEVSDADSAESSDISGRIGRASERSFVGLPTS